MDSTLREPLLDRLASVGGLFNLPIIQGDLMDAAELDKLKTEIRTYGDTVGVSAELLLNTVAQSAVHPAGQRLFLKVFRLIAGEHPREYSESSGYSVETKDLGKCLERDVEIAAKKLYGPLCSP